MIRKIWLTISLLCVCSYAVADVADTGYIGLGIGSVDYGTDANPDFNDPTGFELIVGKEVGRNLSFELSYIDFGEADNGTVPAQRLEADAFTFGLLLMAKAGKAADVFLKLGVHSWDRELTQDNAGVLGRDDGTDILYGLGVMVKTTDNLGIGARYNVYDFDGDDVNMLSVNAQLIF